jgi:hypothetical protein
MVEKTSAVLLEKLLDSKLNTLSIEFKKDLEAVTVCINGVKTEVADMRTVLNKTYDETKKTNGRVTELEKCSELLQTGVSAITKEQSLCKVRQAQEHITMDSVVSKLDIIDKATVFKQALVKSPKLGKRMFWGTLALIIFISLPLWIAYWDVILSVIGSLSRIVN